MLDSLWDLESDFSAIHGIRDMYSLPCPLFFAFIYRMAAYKGVMRMRVEIEEEQKQSRNGRGRGTQVYNEDVHEVSSESISDIAASSELGDLIEVAEG